MDNLKLTFPSPHPGTHLLVETEVDAFSRWLEELPSGNMARYVTEIADAITNINRTDLPIAQRLSLIQLTDKAYETIHDYYRPLTMAGPHKGEHAPIEELKEVYRLTKELSFAYKIAVYEFINKKVLFGKNKNLANAINMALHYLGLVLLEHYELYSPIPMHIWSEIHQLYYTAEQRDLSEFENPDMALRNSFLDSETTYLRICLMALSNPYHLKRGDHWEVFKYLSYWTTKAIISEDPDDFSEKNCFVINLSGEDKPLAFKELANKDNPDYRFILTPQLTMQVIHQIDEIKSTEKSPSKCFSKNIIARKANILLGDMLASWESKQERQAPRYPRINKMEVIWGLQNIHKILSHIDPLVPNNKNITDDSLSHFIEQHWTTVNSSDGGICLSQPNERISSIDVGLLVAIRRSVSDESSAVWTLGKICWITGNQRNGTQVGIQYIKGDIQAVQLQARKGNKIDTRYQPALLLSGEKINGLTTPTILTKSGLYVESRPMILKIGEEVQFIHARMKVSSTSSIDRFFYQPDDDPIPLEDAMQNEEEEKKVPQSEEGEVIDLNAMPMSHAEDFEDEAKENKEKVVTLDDFVVSKNK